jgi:hypothetical protein
LLCLENDPDAQYGQRMTIRSLSQNLGINPDGSAKSLTLKQKLLFGSTWYRIASIIRKSRNISIIHMKNLSNFNHNEEILKNDYLIQLFILEQLPQHQ